MCNFIYLKYLMGIRIIHICEGYDIRSRKQFIKGVTWKLSSIPEMGRAKSYIRLGS